MVPMAGADSGTDPLKGLIDWCLLKARDISRRYFNLLLSASQILYCNKVTCPAQCMFQSVCVCYGLTARDHWQQACNDLDCQWCNSTKVQPCQSNNAKVH